MIDKIVPGPSSPQFRSSASGKKSTADASRVEPESESKEETPQYHRHSYPFVERRSGKDRRQEKQDRVIYDMRQSAGRRKTDRRYPPIETDA